MGFFVFKFPGFGGRPGGGGGGPSNKTNNLQYIKKFVKKISSWSYVHAKI